MLAGGDAVAEFSRRVHGRVHVTLQRALGFGEHVHDFAERHVSDHEQIDVAVVVQLASRRRAIHEGYANAIGQRRKCSSKHVGQPRGLDEQRLQLRKHRRAAVRPEIHLAPVGATRHEPRPDERAQFALHGSRRKAGLPHDLAQKELLVRPAQQPAQDQPPRSSEEHRCDIRLLCSHFANNCTQVANGFKPTF